MFLNWKLISYTEQYAIPYHQKVESNEQSQNPSNIRNQGQKWIRQLLSQHFNGFAGNWQPKLYFMRRFFDLFYDLEKMLCEQFWESHQYQMSNYFILQECAWQAALSCLNQIILKHEHDPFIFLPKVCQHWPVGTHGYIVHSEPSPGRLTPNTGDNACLNTGGKIVFTTWFTGTLREVEFLMFYHLEQFSDNLMLI